MTMVVFRITINNSVFDISLIIVYGITVKNRQMCSKFFFLLKKCAFKFSFICHRWEQRYIYIVTFLYIVILGHKHNVFRSNANFLLTRTHINRITNSFSCHFIFTAILLLNSCQFYLRMLTMIVISSNFVKYELTFLCPYGFQLPQVQARRECAVLFVACKVTKSFTVI